MRANLSAITSRDGRRVAVDARSSIPIYRQLSDQIRLLVEFGELAPGSRLPSASQLADNLDVHRNTVQKAYLTLRRSGVIVSDGSRGTFVSPAKPPPRAASERLLQLLAQLVREAETTALTPGELASLVQLHATAREALHNQSIVFVECNPSSLGHYKGEIERTIGVRVEALLLDNVPNVAGLDLSSSLVVTTFFHYADVRRRLHTAGLGNELVAISVRPHLEVLQQLNDLRSGTRLGVVYLADDPNAAARLSRMYDAITHIHLSGISVMQVAVKADATESDFVGLDAVLVRPENISQVRPFIPRGVRVIEFKNTLDEASLQLLRDTLADRGDAEVGAPIVSLEVKPESVQVDPASGLAYSSDGTGPAVVLLHGLAGFRQLWRDQVPHLVRAGLRVISVDLPGHGDSPDPAGALSIQGMADAVSRLLESLDVSQAAIVGHSMGGRVMFNFAVDRPERVWAIVPVGAQSETPAGEYRGVLAQLKAQTITGGLPAFRAAFMEAGEIPARTQTDPAFARWFWQYFEKNRPASLVKGLDAIFAMRTLTGDLVNIHAPALCLVGSEDAPFLPLARRYEAVMPNCRTVVVNGCRHYPMTDAEPVFSRLLTEFLVANQPRNATWLGHQAKSG